MLATITNTWEQVVIGAVQHPQKLKNPLQYPDEAVIRIEIASFLNHDNIKLLLLLDDARHNFYSWCDKQRQVAGHWVMLTFEFGQVWM